MVNYPNPFYYLEFKCKNNISYSSQLSNGAKILYKPVIPLYSKILHKTIIIIIIIKYKISYFINEALSGLVNSFTTSM